MTDRTRTNKLDRGLSKADAVLLKMVAKAFCVLLSLAVSSSACQTYWYRNPVVPLPIIDSTCKAPTIDKNIVGVWQYQSTMGGISRTGAITFNTDNSVVGPQKVFGDSVPGRFINRTYIIAKRGAVAYGQTGDLIEIRSFGAGQPSPPQGYGSTFLTISNNECQRIRLVRVDRQNTNTSNTLILTR